MKSSYTPEPKVDGEIISNNGVRALVIEYRQNGGVVLNIYEWVLDTRYNKPTGSWVVCAFGTIILTLAEREALSGVFQ